MLLLITKSLTRPVLSIRINLKRNTCEVNREKGWVSEFAYATSPTIRTSRNAEVLVGA